MSFRHLAHQIGEDFRFYGIQAPVEFRNGEFATSIETIARFYAEELISFQPEGPFLLGGWSAGSTIALEIAQQLQRLGRGVALLVAFDGAPFNLRAGVTPRHPLYYWKVVRNLPLWVADDLARNWSARAFGKRVRNKVRAFYRKMASFLSPDTFHGHTVEGFLDTSYYAEGHIMFMRALFSALRRYVPQYYGGNVILYTATTQPLYHFHDVAAVWKKLADRVEALPVRGTHESILNESYVSPIAQHLRARLAEFHLHSSQRVAVFEQ